MIPAKPGLFCDFCVSDTIDSKKLNKFLKLGYKTLALNKTVDETVFEIKKKSKKSESRENADIIPAPVEIPKDIDASVIILRRLTVHISEISSCLKLNQSENAKKYDILAVIPTSAAALNHACATMDVDIISFSPEARTMMKINRKLYKQAVDRGIYFEIMYAPALKDSSCRRNIIQRAHLYHAIGKSANILITSGAETEYQIRGPYDVLNLGLILGLNEKLCKNSMTENARKLLLKADNRKRGKAAVFVSFSTSQDNYMDQNDNADSLHLQCKRIRTESS